MAETRKRLFLIDGYSNIFRAFYAIRHLSNSKGQETNAVYGFINMLRKLLREEQPDLIGVALDVSSDTVRKERFSEYKANRKPMPEDLRPQIPWVRRAIEAYRIPIREEAGYEADDVLGTLSRKAVAAGLESDDPVDLGEERIVSPQPYIPTGMELGPTLPNDDAASLDRLPTISFHAKKLRVAVPTVPAGAYAFFMCHRYPQ